jgi:hypothetical protein
VRLEDVVTGSNLIFPVKHPERVQALIVQNGNAYEEGLREFWEPLRAYWQAPTAANAAALRKFLVLEATKWQYTHGVRNVAAISPGSLGGRPVPVGSPGHSWCGVRTTTSSPRTEGQFSWVLDAT